ncbi:hypothetical protein SDC9_102198 [bioreactor metagenome]|uniref:Uncharacterized protein n=1 Tax=bioreactor metagenome TaxID=1076179 RepID=A0A644XZI8_9ZZZZ
MGDHHGQLQFFGTLYGNGCTNKPPGVRFHKVDLFRGNTFGGDNQIAFVFAVFVINHDNKVTLFYFFDSFFYRV